MKTLIEMAGPIVCLLPLFVLLLVDALVKRPMNEESEQ